MHSHQQGLEIDTNNTRRSNESGASRSWLRFIFSAQDILRQSDHYSPVVKILKIVDSVVWFYRLWGVLDYINRKGYEESDYQTWRLGQRELSPANDGS